VVLFDADMKKELGRFDFSNVIGQGKTDKFNVAQFYNDVDPDIIGLQISTGGSVITKALATMKDSDQESALLLQGLGDRLAEDMAEYTNQQVVAGVFDNGEGGSVRYSPGYPAMADIRGNKLIFDLLQAQEKLGITLTDGFEFHPTCTTAAIVCFHPDAAYH